MKANKYSMGDKAKSAMKKLTSIACKLGSRCKPLKAKTGSSGTRG